MATDKLDCQAEPACERAKVALLVPVQWERGAEVFTQ